MSRTKKATSEIAGLQDKYDIGPVDWASLMHLERPGKL
jgi:hypothetical protein